jgi:multiple sugar transport system ATP-binding protein
MSGVRLESVSKTFPGGSIAVRDLSLEVLPGEFVVLVGPSGCGKTTTLRMVSGLEEVSEGEIYIDGRRVTKLPPRHRDVAMVFQNYALYAHMTVRDNIGFGLRMHGMSKQEITRHVDEAAHILAIEELLKRKPRQLSGGQRQRVAMGRAIVREPSAFLMDEPLSNLDAKLRVEMRAEISSVQRRIGAPTLYVTHDQTEAMTMGDRVAVLLDGVLQQFASPEELYDHPANTFIAGFIGSPAMNLLAAHLTCVDGRFTVEFGGLRVAVPRSILERGQALAGYVDRTIIVGVRPEDIVDADQQQPPAEAMRVIVKRTESLGAERIIYFIPEAGEPRQDGVEALELPKARAGALLTARLPRGRGIRDDSVAHLALDAERLYFFDGASGAAIR